MNSKCYAIEYVLSDKNSCAGGLVAIYDSMIAAEQEKSRLEQLSIEKDDGMYRHYWISEHIIRGAE